MIRILREVMIKIAWAGKFFTSSILFAPRYCETIDEMALLVCPSTHISIEIKAPTIPTAASDSVALTSIFPTMAVSVIDNIGSEIPEIKAGMANLLICLRPMVVFIELVHSNEKERYFDLGNRHPQVFGNLAAHKISDFVHFEKMCPTE